MAQELGRYPSGEVIWCQEGPENQGGWFFVDRRIEAVLAELGGKCKRPVYVGRAPGAAPATGSLKRHNKEQEAILNQALGSAATTALAANG